MKSILKTKKQKSGNHGELLLELKTMRIIYPAHNRLWLRRVVLKDDGAACCALPGKVWLPERKQKQQHHHKNNKTAIVSLACHILQLII